MTESAWLQTPLFAGIPPEDADKLLSCLQGERKRFQKGEMIYRAGEQARALGLVLSGAVHIESCDAWGNRSLLGVVMPGQIFAEVYACVPNSSYTPSTADQLYKGSITADGRIVCWNNNICGKMQRKKDLFSCQRQGMRRESRFLQHTAPHRCCAPR